MKHTFKQAFTLVELIVVITILAVLATVAFISFQGYTSSSRDSVRLADLKNISKSLELLKTQNIDLPLPDKKVELTASWVIFQYQGELSSKVLTQNLNIFDGGVDPLTGENYWYAINLEKNKFQVIWFLENQESVVSVSQNKVFADNLDKYMKSSGDNLGVLIDQTTNEIITDSNNNLQIDVISTSNTYSVARNNVIESVDSWELKQLIWSNFSSCKDLLAKFPQLESGEYNLWNFWWVYCDMEFQWGGWTAIGKYKNWSPKTTVNFIELGNSIVENASEFAALTFNQDGSLFASHTAKVNYDGKNKWYLDNYDNSNTTERFVNINTTKLWYWVYQKDNIVNKYKDYGNGFSILNFSEYGMEYRLHTQTINHVRYGTGKGCILSAYVPQEEYPFGESSSQIIQDNECNASFNPYTIWLMFR